MYVLSPDNVSTAYPYGLEQLRRDNPSTSFPSNADDALLSEWGVFKVNPTVLPVVDYTRTVTEGAPVFESGKWVQVWSVTDASAAEVEHRTAMQAESVRSQRNAKLSATDWTQVADAPVDQAAWATYRQALRDLTTQAGFPWTVDWPITPE